MAQSTAVNTEKKPVIEFRNFSFQYFAQAQPTLRDINLTIYEGEKILIVGASGSGKSTLGHCINGLIPFSYNGNITGSLKVCAQETVELDIFKLSKKVGTVLQDSDGQFIGLTVGEDIAFALENDCRPLDVMKTTVKKTAALVGMHSFLTSSPHELSGGQKQRVSFAGVMVNDVNVLLFDEPLANLDPKTGQTAIELIDDIYRTYKKTVIIIEHRIEDVLHCPVDRIIVVDGGKIACDMSADALMASGKLLSFGIREPLYVSALRRAGIKLTEKLHCGRLETLDVGAVRSKVVQWGTSLPEKKACAHTNEILRAENVSFRYAPRSPAVLNDINFSIREGEMLSLVGTNGAGKSTLAKIISGIVKESGGRLLLRGEDMSRMNIRERSRHIGFVMQNPNQMLCKPMIYDEIALGLRLNGIAENEIKERVEHACKICGILSFIKWPVSALSYGQKKRITIASVLAMQPNIIILDEPTAGQDYRHYREIMEFLVSLNKSGVTIILITHDMHLMLEYTERTLVLHAGSLLLDASPVQALTDSVVAEKASLKLTSLYRFAQMAGIKDSRLFVQNFIDYERRSMHESKTV